MSVHSKKTYKVLFEDGITVRVKYTWDYEVSRLGNLAFIEKLGKNKWAVQNKFMYKPPRVLSIMLGGMFLLTDKEIA